MLTRLASAAIIVAVFALLVAPVPPASADGDAKCTQIFDPETGQLKWVCEDTETTPGPGNGGSSTCKYAGKEIPCTGPEGSVWSSKYECWIGARGPNDMNPPPGQTEEDGWWHVCYFPPPGSSWEYMWIETGEIGVDPVVLAQRAIASMDLDPIAIGIAPESGANRAGLVGLPVWMWVDGPTDVTFGPITASASEGSVSVSATASVSSIVWNMGDGTTVTCSGSKAKGTPYTDGFGKQPSPTCGHRYEKMSSSQPDGAYQVTASSHWVVEWAGGGQSGTIEFDLTTDPLPIRIGEAQVLTQ